MNQEHEIVQLVYDAKDDLHAADSLIGQYLPFIKSETSKFINRAPVEGQDDELSIAMIAFHEAIRNYDKTKGSFLSFASMLIRNRLIDFWRANKKHNKVVSLETPTFRSDEGENKTLGDELTDGSDHAEEHVQLEATQAEIDELSQQMADFGVSLSDVAENSPKQDRTLKACQQALDIAKSDAEMMNDFLRLKRIPMKLLSEKSGVAKKTLERHRKYLVALLIIYSNGYEIIRGHLKQMRKGGNA